MGGNGDVAVVTDDGMGSISNSEPHEMRITDHGKIHSFVSFALEFLQVSRFSLMSLLASPVFKEHMEENPHRPLILHTLPATKDTPISGQTVNTRPQIAIPPELEANAVEDSSAEPVKKKCKLTRSTTTIPRLVSVVEIIKREYAKEASARQTTNSGSPNNSLRLGLHQYNELTTLEALGIVVRQGDVSDDAEQLRQALEGKNL